MAGVLLGSIAVIVKSPRDTLAGTIPGIPLWLRLTSENGEPDTRVERSRSGTLTYFFAFEEGAGGLTSRKNAITSGETPVAIDVIANKEGGKADDGAIPGWLLELVRGTGGDRTHEISKKTEGLVPDSSVKNGISAERSSTPGDTSAGKERAETLAANPAKKTPQAPKMEKSVFRPKAKTKTGFELFNSKGEAHSFYTFLKPKDGQSPSLEEAEPGLMKSELPFVIQRSFGGFHSFAVFESAEAGVRWYEGVAPESRNFFETLYGERPRRMYYDLETERKKNPPPEHLTLEYQRANKTLSSTPTPNSLVVTLRTWTCTPPTATTKRNLISSFQPT